MIALVIRTLFILRHAKAETGEGLRDEERPLTARGRRAAERVGELMADRVPERVLSSTAVRTRETVAALKKGAQHFGPVAFLPELYLAEPSACLKALAEHGGDATSVLLVGHNPGLEDLVSLLTGERVSLPTAALAECALDLDAWSAVTVETRAELIGLAYPRDP
jgi:phosphohistidine phosphatase